MVRIIKKVWAWLFRIEGTEGVILWLFPSTASLFTAVRAYMAGVPWHLIMFYGTGVLAFTMGAVFIATEHIRKRTVKGRIALVGFELKKIEISKSTGVITFFPEFRLISHADREIFFKIKRLNVVLDGKVNQNASIHGMVSLMQARSNHYILGAGVPGIQAKQQILGKLELELLYGASPDALTFLWDYQGHLELVFPAQTDPMSGVEDGVSMSRCADIASEHRSA